MASPLLLLIWLLASVFIFFYYDRNEEIASVAFVYDLWAFDFVKEER